MEKEKVLIADDEKNIRLPCKEILEDEGYQVYMAENGLETINIIDKNDIDVLLLDLRMPLIDGIEIIRKLHNKVYKPEIIVITGHGTINDAVIAIKLGAYDFLEKPIQPERLSITLRNCLIQRRLEKENKYLKDGNSGGLEIYANNKKMAELEKKISKIGPTDCYVLITGETGTGKELIARKLFMESKRAKQPFIEVNCSAIPKELIESELFGHVKGAFTGAYLNKKGKFEQANNGTIFLDEIADMDLAAQAKVLRVLENGEINRVGSLEKIQVDFRVLSATNKDLIKEIKEGKFREDLYFRLNVVQIDVPPLRERKEDVPIFIKYFLDYFLKRNNLPTKELTSKAMDVLLDYHWPGNVRELKNLIEKMAILSSSDIIDAWELEMIWEKPKIHCISSESIQNYKLAKDMFEKEFILSALKRNNGNIQMTANEMGLNRTYLYQKIQELKIY